jgi:hypothetical protein
MRVLATIILLILATSCGTPTAAIPSPTPSPPEPPASTSLAPGASAPTRTPAPPIIVEAAGARFQIEDAAVYSNCLTVAFAVRGFRPPTGLQPHAFLPPARSIDVTVITPDGELLAEPLPGDQASQGNEEDGRIWLLQHAEYSLPREIPLDQEVVLEVTAILDQDFQSAQPLSYRFSVVSSSDPSSCS